MRIMRLFFVLLTLSFLYSCKENNTEDSAAHSLKIKAKIFDDLKAKEFNEKYQLTIPYQSFMHIVSMNFKQNGIDTNFHAEWKSFLLQSDVYGHPESIDTMAIDTSVEQSFIIWYQPLNFSDTSIYYYYNNKLVESDFNKSFKKEYLLGDILTRKFDAHSVINDYDGNIYYAQYEDRSKLMGKDSVLVVDFDFFKLNKVSQKKELLFSASDVVDDRMLISELFEEVENPLYKNLDVYHWNWFQLDKNKMYINYAFSGMQQVNLPDKKVDWHWGYKHHTFSKITGVGDLTGPYYTHHLNKIESGPYKGMYSYFENGCEPLGNKKYKPARARIFEVDTVKNTLNIVWEQVYDFASSALGSINVFDDYILVNVGLALPMKNIQDKYHQGGKKTAADYYFSLNRPMLYLYDSKGNPISEYVYEPGFYSYINYIKKREPK